jgi:hypothetical protein
MEEFPSEFLPRQNPPPSPPDSAGAAEEELSAPEEAGAATGEAEPEKKPEHPAVGNYERLMSIAHFAVKAVCSSQMNVARMSRRVFLLTGKLGSHMESVVDQLKELLNTISSPSCIHSLQRKLQRIVDDFQLSEKIVHELQHGCEKLAGGKFSSGTSSPVDSPASTPRCNSPMAELWEVSESKTGSSSSKATAPSCPPNTPTHRTRRKLRRHSARRSFRHAPCTAAPPASPEDAQAGAGVDRQGEDGEGAGKDTDSCQVSRSSSIAEKDKGSSDVSRSSSGAKREKGGSVSRSSSSRSEKKKEEEEEGERTSRNKKEEEREWENKRTLNSSAPPIYTPPNPPRTLSYTTPVIHIHPPLTPLETTNFTEAASANVPHTEDVSLKMIADTVSHTRAAGDASVMVLDRGEIKTPPSHAVPKSSQSSRTPHNSPTKKCCCDCHNRDSGLFDDAASQTSGCAGVPNTPESYHSRFHTAEQESMSSGDDFLDFNTPSSSTNEKPVSFKSEVAESPKVSPSHTLSSGKWILLNLEYSLGCIFSSIKDNYK